MSSWMFLVYLPSGSLILLTPVTRVCSPPLFISSLLFPLPFFLSPILKSFPLSPLSSLSLSPPPPSLPFLPPLSPLPSPSLFPSLPLPLPISLPFPLTLSFSPSSLFLLLSPPRSTAPSYVAYLMKQYFSLLLQEKFTVTLNKDGYKVSLLSLLPCLPLFSLPFLHAYI